MRLLLLAIAALALVLGGVFVATGTSLIPPTVVLGPCFRDWSSPSSYETRQSPLATVRFRVGDAHGTLCYGRPAMRGRAIFGELVPYGEPWRLGANEPTRLYLDEAVTLAGIPLRAGRYSLYAIPRPEVWTILVSRSVTHWGNDISPAVRAREVGQANVPVELLAEPVETLTVTTKEAGPGRLHLVFRWERTRLALELTRPGVPPDLGNATSSAADAAPQGRPR